MTYTNNVPQGNQTIAETQSLIQDNFGFLQTSLRQDHNFNGLNPFGVQQEGTHIQVSMPNQSADPVALPTGCAGTYYVKGGVPKFYDGTTASDILLSAGQFTPFTDNLSISTVAGSNAAPITVNGSNITGNLGGYVVVFPTSQITTAQPFIVIFYQSGSSKFRFIQTTGNNTGSFSYTVTYSGGVISISQTSVPPQTVNYTYYGWYMPF